MNEISELGGRIKRRRKHLNFTQKDIAELTGISERTIRSIEKGEQGAAIGAWHKILNVLGLEMKILFKPMSDETGKRFL